MKPLYCQLLINKIVGLITIYVVVETEMGDLTSSCTIVIRKSMKNRPFHLLFSLIVVSGILPISSYVATCNTSNLSH